MALSAGTGSAVVARGPAGVEWSASFWIVDPMGGGSLGRAAFNAVVRAELGIDPATRLTAILLTHFGHDDVASMLEAGTRRGGAPPVYAGLARDVLDAARGGTSGRAGSSTGQARSLARYARAACVRAGLDDTATTVVLGGSVLSSENPALRDATVAALAEELPDAHAVLSPRSPVVGAAAEAIAETPRVAARRRGGPAHRRTLPAGVPAHLRAASLSSSDAMGDVDGQADQVIEGGSAVPP